MSCVWKYCSISTCWKWFIHVDGECDASLLIAFEFFPVIQYVIFVNNILKNIILSKMPL